MNPQITKWRGRSAVDADLGYGWPATSPAVQLVPVDYTPPQLLPTENGVEAAHGRKEILVALQSWEGVVLDVDEDSFIVRLVDVSGEHEDEEVELSKDELSEFDLELLEPGAILYWTIGYRERVRGSRERVSRIRLRRVPAWTQSQLTEAKERAAALARDLAW